MQRALQSRSAAAGPFYESVGDSLPCRAIGGDFFDFIDLPSGDLGIVMGDVAGKGPAAALLAALIQGMLEGDADAKSPAGVLARVNGRLIARDFGARFATLVYAVLSPDGRLVYSNAGHNPPALLEAIRPGARRLQPSEVQRLTIGGPILGSFNAASFEEGIVHLQPGDVVVMFTDGVTEARNAADEEFGEARLLKCLENAPGSGSGTAAARHFRGGADVLRERTSGATTSPQPSHAFDRRRLQLHEVLRLELTNRKATRVPNGLPDCRVVPGSPADLRVPERGSLPEG